MNSNSIAVDGTRPGFGRTLDGDRTPWWHRVGDRLSSPVGIVSLAAVAFAAGLVASASGVLPWTAAAELRVELAERTAALEDARGELAVKHIQHQRLREVQAFSAEHGIPADLAATVYDIALAEGVEPEIAFRLVETESSFRRMAVSEAGAMGYTQIKPSTAAWLDPSVTPDELFETTTNLRLGFRYLSLLLEENGGDARMALLAYNRGPNRVRSLLATGRDPSNGYASRILAGSP